MPDWANCLEFAVGSGDEKMSRILTGKAADLYRMTGYNYSSLYGKSQTPRLNASPDFEPELVTLIQPLGLFGFPEILDRIDVFDQEILILFHV